MTTEPVIIPPANFTDADVANWMREKLQYMNYLNNLHAERRKLVDELARLDTEIAEYTNKSAIQIQSK
ncbi:hypothetical protein ACNARU_18020 [Proteus sp. WDL240414]|uniref:hypothetical protein n=1 Tax=Proteus TaxID=583 RepID=UPI0021BBB4D9|nr:hypothetical protein [Proteus terrae]MCT8265579.1 hypothetical protein [Proteus terrae]